MTDVAKVIEKIIKMREDCLDPVEFSKKFGTDPYSFRDETAGHSYRQRSVGYLPLLTPEKKAEWERSLHNLG